MSLQTPVAQPPVRIRRSPTLGGMHGRAKERGRAEAGGSRRGSAPRIWSTHRRELPDPPATYAHTVQAAARDAVRAALAHGPNSPDAAAAVRHLWPGCANNMVRQFCRT